MLGVPADALRHNPLMLENALHQPPASDPPEVEEGELAASRAVEKARLRRAEAVLLAEERSGESSDSRPPASATGGGWAASLKRPVHETAAAWAGRESELLSWYDDAKAQLALLREPIAAWHQSKSTGRMSIPRREKLQPMDHAAAHAASTNMSIPAPKKLTELLSTSPAAAKGQQMGKPKLRSITAEMYAPRGAAPTKPVQKGQVVQARYLEPKTAWSENAKLKERRGNGEPSAPVPPSVAPADSSKEIRPMTPSVRHPLSAAELEELLSISEPSESITVVAAAVLIILTPGNSVPSDVRWSAFASQPSVDLLGAIGTLEAKTIPNFKLRALRRFLSVNAFDPLSLAAAGSLAAAKLAVWVLRVIAAHPEGGVISVEVRSSLDAWEVAQRQAKEDRQAGSPGQKKKKKSKRKRKPAVETPTDRLLDDVRQAGMECSKHVMAELKVACRGTLNAQCSRALEAVALVLEPKKKPSPDTVKALVSKATTRGEPTFDSRVREYGYAEAERVAERGVRLLEVYLTEPELEDDSLKVASQAIAVLMRWVRAVAALVLFTHGELQVRRLEIAEQNRAATKLQGLQRKAQARQRAAEQRAIVIEQREAREQNMAATKLQGVQRGRQATKRVEQIRRDRPRGAGGVGFENDDADADRGPPKEIFALSRDDYSDDEHGDYEEEDGDARDAGQQASADEESSSAARVIQGKENQRAANKVLESERLAAREKDASSGGGDLEVGDCDDDAYGDEVFASPPKTSPRRPLLSAGSEGYGDNDFEDENYDDDE